MIKVTKTNYISAFVLLVLLVGFVFLMPATVLANEHGPVLPLVPECGHPHEDCTFDHLIALVNNVLLYLVLISAPIAAVIFAYAGFLMVTSAGSEEKVKKAKGIFVKVVIGFVFVLAAWLIVHFIMVALVDPCFFDQGDQSVDLFNIADNCDSN